MLARGMTKALRSTRNFTPLTDSLYTCDQDTHVEKDNRNGEEAPTPSWVDGRFESSLSLEADWQFETLFHVFPSEKGLTEAEREKAERAMEMEGRQIIRQAPPASPESSDSSYHQQTNPIPRHKRPSHKRAELKRRDKIKAHLDEVKATVPSIRDKGKMSECAILSKAAEYTKHLLGECERFSTEAGNLRREIESLSSEIQ